MSMYALILAGGSGTRLWPHSRTMHPKQFLKMNGHKTMLQETVERTLPIIPPERVFVATGAMYAPLVAEQLPDVPRENILGEPSGRSTAPCIGLAALHLLRRDPNAVMAVLSADHLIEESAVFCQKLLLAEEVAQQGYLVTMGIQPDMPCTSYGYIQCGDVIHSQGAELVYRVRSFVEKPDRTRAEAYLASGDYLWNAGMFVWRADMILQELSRYRPQMMSALTLIDAAIGTPHEQAVLEAVWQNIENVPIDIAVMEQTSLATVIPADVGWSDVGDWDSLAEAIPCDHNGNAVIGSHLGVDTARSLIYGNGRLVATIGVTDMVIVDTHDVLLICPRERAQDVKTMVQQVRQQYQHLV